MLKRNNFREICVYLQPETINNDDYGNDNRKKTHSTAQRQVAAYIRKEFGTKRAKRFKQEVDDTVKQLMRSPDIERWPGGLLCQGLLCDTYNSISHILIAKSKNW